jgi:hypothetical protein
MDHERLGAKLWAVAPMGGVLALTTSARVGIVIAGGFVIWILLAAAAATYGSAKGYPFFPLFISALFLGPLGWALVLLAVTIGAGPRRRGSLAAPRPPRSLERHAETAGRFRRAGHETSDRMQAAAGVRTSGTPRPPHSNYEEMTPEQAEAAAARLQSEAAWEPDESEREVLLETAADLVKMAADRRTDEA